MRTNVILGFLLWLTCALAFAQEAPYREGVHYFEIDQATAPPGDHVEVTEAFSYLCTHCATFEPYVANWKQKLPENVELKRIPVGFGRRAWELYARGYVTARLMGIEEKSHQPMMDRIWKDQKMMRSLEQLAEFYAQFGVEEDAFIATAQSFNVDTQLRRDQRLVQTYGITGTPTMIVNGKYRVSSSQQVPSFDAMLSVVDYLVAQELATLPSATAPDQAAAPATDAEAEQ